MCFGGSKPPPVKPVRQAPTPSPEIIDDVAVRERDRDRLKRRQMYGRQATILAGGSGAGAPATASVKTALGA